MIGQADLFLEKAEESLAGAASEFTNGRYNNCANRSYYACFLAAIRALQRAGIEPRGEQWGHAFVQAQFVGELINRRKLYPATLRDVLRNRLALRGVADYEADRVSQVCAERMLRRARELVEAIERPG